MRWDFHVQLFPLSWSTVKMQPLKLTLMHMIYHQTGPKYSVFSYQPFLWSQPCYKMLSYHTHDVEEILWGAWEHTEDSVSCSVHPAINYINSSREFYLLYGLRSLQNMTHPSWQNSRVPCSRNLETKWKLVLIFSDTILPSSGRVL